MTNPMTVTSPLTHTGHEIAELLSENAHLREIEAANKETIKYWRGQYAQAQSAVNFYDGIVLGDGDHDKAMLARDGDIFMRLMKALGMDVSGSDVQEIVDRVEELRDAYNAMATALSETEWPTSIREWADRQETK